MHLSDPDKTKQSLMSRLVLPAIALLRGAEKEGHE